MIDALIESIQNKNQETLKNFLSSKCALKLPHTPLILNQQDVIDELVALTITEGKISPYLSYHLLETSINGARHILKIKHDGKLIKSIYGEIALPDSRRIRLDLSYDGTRYQGYQRQPDKPTIQGELECALSQLLGEGITVHAASRTDTAVHALHQVVHFDTKNQLDTAIIIRQLNHSLPPDIRIDDIAIVPQIFHGRYDTIKKTYRYILDHAYNPLNAHHTLHHPNIDTEALNNILGHFEGTHDFKSFSKGPDKGNTYRTIYRACAYRSSNRTIITITGDGFLRHMVRMMVGSALHDLTKHTDTHLQALAHPNKDAIKHRAEPQGLYLESIDYL